MGGLVHVSDERQSAIVPSKEPRTGALPAVANRLCILVRAHSAELVTACLLLVMAANLLSVISKKSITIDETSAIPSGYYYLTEDAFDINCEHPPLPKILAALPLLFLNVERPPLSQVPGDNYSQRTVMTSAHFWTANRADFRRIFFWARVPMVVITILLGALIFLYARRLFSARAAVFAVALYSLEPNILAHGRVIKDIYVALAYLFFFAALHLYVSAPRLRNALTLGFATGVAPAMKFSLGIVAPIFLVSVLVLLALAPRLKQKRARLLVHLAVAAAVALLVVNASYLFQHEALIAADTESLRQTLSTAAAPWLVVAHWLSPLFPPYFIFGILVTFAHDVGDHHVFLYGLYSTKGWWYYLPAAFVVKTTLPFLLLTVAAIAWVLREIIRGKLIFLALLGPVVLYTLTAMLTSVNIGIRHFLPVFPFLLIMSGALLDHVLGRQHHRRATLAIVGILFAWMTFAAIRAYPDYIPYMNELASGRPHWQTLSDSNVEWGDDTGAVAQYLAARGERSVRAAFLGGSVLLPLYGVEYVDLLAPPGTSMPETRYVALGASFLNGTSVPGWSEGSGRETKEQQRTYFAAYRDRQPEAIFGKTIYLYRVK